MNDFTKQDMEKTMKSFCYVLNAIEELPKGQAIPKPRSHESRISHWGIRRGERALVYSMPNSRMPGKPHEKGITISEFEQAFETLQSTGEFTRKWFETHMEPCNKEGSCNFTSIGGIFILAGVAVYSGQGVYRKQ